MSTQITLTSKDLPEIADWKVGEHYELVLMVEQTGLNKDEMYTEGGEMETLSARFEVLKVKGKKKQMQDHYGKMHEKDVAKMLSGEMPD